MGQELPGSSLGEAHEVFDLHVMVELRLFIRWQPGCLLALDEIPDPLARTFRRFEPDDLTRAERGNKLNDLFVRSHTGKFRTQTPIWQD